ncbi:MAG: transposase, partial [Cyanobacteria bacterium]|nr:transposase [Cyanobacteriota bacterium]
GHITAGVMHLNDAGQIAHQCWLAIPDHFPNIALDEFIIMPNHVHGIIHIATQPDRSGDLESSPSPDQSSPSPDQSSPSPDGRRVQGVSPLPSQPRGTSKTIGSIVRGFKIGVTKWMRQNTGTHTVWQRNYWEHIIRTQPDQHRIRHYIRTNPQKWTTDKLFTPSLP